MTRDQHIATHGDGAVFAEDWTGPRFRYGYRNRPFAMSHQPRNFLIDSVAADVRIPDRGVRHGTIDYPFQLSAEEIYNFELVDLGEVTP